MHIMSRILFFLCLASVVNLISAQATLEHYIIYIKSTPNGYITIETTFDHVSQTKIRKTRTALKTKQGTTNFDDQLLEESYYVGDMLVKYSWEKIWQMQLLDQQKYTLDSQKINIAHIRSGKELGNKTLPISDGITMLGDYFSFISILQQGHPRTFFAVDLKQINMDTANVVPQPLLVKPLGKQKAKIASIEYMADVYQAQWQNLSPQASNNGFQIWVDSTTKQLILIQDLQGNMKIAISSSKEVQKLSQITQESYFKKLRPLPYRLGQTYHYRCSSEQKYIGDVYFTITGPGSTQSYYEVIATGKFSRKNKDFVFESVTRYNDNYNPIFYSMQEDGRIDIVCEFGTEGIRETFRRDTSSLEYFLPITPDTIFLDNSAIHHFAVFLCQANLDYNSQFSLSIFHPRRLQINPAKFRVSQSYTTYRLVELETQFHKVQMKVGLDGLLYEYVQDKVVVQLMDK